MTNDQIGEIFQAWWLKADEGDFEWLKDNRPLLAHYTSIDVAEKMLQHEKIWFSNPTYMNDHSEMVYGINKATHLFLNHEKMDTFPIPNFKDIVMHIYEYYISEFETKHMLDVYIACFCQHDIEDTDGLLSMWRCYGAQGNGVALVFNTGFISHSDSPIIYISKVQYKSNSDRDKALSEVIDSWFDEIENAK